MTFRSDDERALLEGFLKWLTDSGWFKVEDVEIQQRLVHAFLQTRKIAARWGKRDNNEMKASAEGKSE